MSRLSRNSLLGGKIVRNFIERLINCCLSDVISRIFFLQIIEKRFQLTDCKFLLYILHRYRSNDFSSASKLEPAPTSFGWMLNSFLLSPIFLIFSFAYFILLLTVIRFIHSTNNFSIQQFFQTWFWWAGRQVSKQIKRSLWRLSRMFSFVQDCFSNFHLNT